MIQSLECLIDTIDINVHHKQHLHQFTWIQDQPHQNNPATNIYKSASLTYKLLLWDTCRMVISTMVYNNSAAFSFNSLLLSVVFPFSHESQISGFHNDEISPREMNQTEAFGSIPPTHFIQF